jgi:hypothetical protein
MFSPMEYNIGPIPVTHVKTGFQGVLHNTHAVGCSSNENLLSSIFDNFLPQAINKLC